MVSLHVDTGVFDGAGARVREVTKACAADATLVAAAFGQVAAASLDSDLADAASGAAQRWGTAVAAHAGVVGALAVGVDTAGSRYDAVERAALLSFAGSR